MSDVCFSSCNTQTHTALNVLQFWQNVQGEAVGLPSRPITSVHEVAKSQHQAKHLQYTLPPLESLDKHTYTHTNKRDEEMKVKLSDRKEKETKGRQVAHLAYSLKDFYFAED